MKNIFDKIEEIFDFIKYILYSYGISIFLVIIVLIIVTSMFMCEVKPEGYSHIYDRIKKDCPKLDISKEMEDGEIRNYERMIIDDRCNDMEKGRYKNSINLLIKENAKTE